jgi:hypothetical protein
MRQACIAAALTLVLPAKSYARVNAPCQPRVTIGAALGLLPANIPVDPVLAGGHLNVLAESTGTALEGSIHALFPITDVWRLTTEFGGSTMDVVVTRNASGDYQRTETATDLALQRFTVGLGRAGARGAVCTYAAVKAGVYRFSYEGVTTNAPGVAGVMGFEGPVSGPWALFFELEISVAVTKARAPITPAGVVGNIRPAFGFRWRF